MTSFDLVTLAIFAGLVVLFLQRSIDKQEYQDHIWQYLIAACGCALANYVGNQGYVAFAIILVLATLIFIMYVLRPFPSFPFR